MGLEGLALMFGPTGLGLFSQEKAEELQTQIASSPLTILSPVLGAALPLFSAITSSGTVSNPLFRADASNDNSAPVKIDEDSWPTDSDGLMKVGMDLLETDNAFFARDAFLKAGEADPENSLADFWYAYASLQMGPGGAYAAVTSLDSYIETNPEDADGYALRAAANRQILADYSPESIDADTLKEKILQDEAMSLALDSENQLDQLQKVDDLLRETVPDSPEDSKEALNGLNLLAQRYLSMGTVPFDNADTAEKVSGEMNFLAGRTYEVMENFCYNSPYEEIHERAPLYAALSTLAKGDAELAETQLKDIREKFPEADAIVTQMERDRLGPKNEAALKVWEDFISEGKNYELNQATGFLGVTCAAIEFAVTLGEEHVTDRVYEKWNNEQRLVTEVRDVLSKNPDATLLEALKTISESDADESLKQRAAKILEESENGMDNAGSYVLGHYLKLASQDQADPELVQTVMHDFDQLAVRMGGNATAFDGYFTMLGMVNDEEVRAELDNRMKKLNGGKGIGDYIWDEIRTIGTDDLATLAIMGAASRVGSATRLASFNYFVKGGMEARKAFALSWAAGVGAEGSTFWALNTVHQGWDHNLEDVMDPARLGKTYVASLCMIGGAQGFSLLGNTTGNALSKSIGLVTEDGSLTLGGRTIVWGLQHGASLGGMVGSNQALMTVGFVDAPEGGRGEAAIRDVFGYLKFAMAPRLFKSLGFKEIPAPRLPEAVIQPRAAVGEPTPDLSLARQAPAKTTAAEPTTTADPDVTSVREVPKGVDVNETAQRKFVSEVVVGNNLKAEIKDGSSSTDKMAERSDAIGENAREFKKLSDAYDAAYAKFETAADAYKKNPTTENLNAANDVWAKEVDPALDALKNSPHYRLQEAHAARVGAVQLEVRPLQMELAGMESRAKASGKSLKYEVTFKRPDELNLDPSDPIGSMKKMSAKDLVTVSVTADNAAEITQADNLLRAKGLLNGNTRVIFGCLSEPSGVEPSTKPSAKPSSLLPEGASFAAAGPTLGAMLHAFGASPFVSTIVGIAGVAAMFLPSFGMVFSRSRIYSAPEVLKPQLRDTPIGLNKEGTLGWVEFGNQSGYVVRRNGPEQILVNGKPIADGGNWTWVTSGDVIKAGGKTYTFETGFEKEPTSIRNGQREAARPYKLDDSFRMMDGPASSGVYKANPRADAEGRFVSVRADDGRVVAVMVEGNGRSVGQSNAAVETEASLPADINGGASLETALLSARAHVEGPYLKNDGTVRAGAPKIKASGVEMESKTSDSGKIKAKLVADGDIPLMVVRLGGGNKPTVVPEGVTPMELQPGNDVVVAGRALSPDAIAYIVKNTQPATADAMRDNLQQEALIRAKIMENKPQGGRLTSADYRAAYRSVTGNEAPQGWHGLYEGGFLAQNGKIYDGAGNPTGDSFSLTPGGFLVQIAGQ